VPFEVTERLGAGTADPVFSFSTTMFFFRAVQRSEFQFLPKDLSEFIQCDFHFQKMLSW
jgi:hypothetical protein